VLAVLCLLPLVTACTPAQKAAFSRFVATYSMSPEVEPVMQCIKEHESGDYQEHSHPTGSSGAYQWQPASWSSWFGRWRDAVGFVGSDYPLAYLAPPLIQDAVTQYALTHGGAGNWSMRWGNDPCTAGLPGGGCWSARSMVVTRPREDGMNLLARRSALVLELAALDSTRCAFPGCGHELGRHLPTQRGPQQFACKSFVLHGEAPNMTPKPCRCKEFSTDEQLEVGV
jgi:hypothetical protein